MKIAEDKVVDIDFIVTDEQGQVIDTTNGSEPMSVLIGSGIIVPGLEDALIGHQAGEQIQCEVSPEDAYGIYNPDLVQTIDKSLFGDNEINVGDMFLADTDLGPAHISIKEINDNDVVVDGNHPLAGKVLKFVVDIISVRDATEDELAHGHVHVNGECCNDEHHCCCGHHHDEEEHQCCGRHRHEEGQHHCCGRHHHD
jgi:FKBP-type peptidyl-prolyl cis-trans isomerase SlyD